MPVYHKRMNVPKAKGELYGPIDGVKPEDHLITYSNLLYLLCCQTIEEVYEHVETREVKYCHTCYVDMCICYKVNFLRVAHHTLVRERIAFDGQICLRCQRIIMRVKLAIDCRDCIEEYLICNNSRIWESGRRVVVTQRWIE